MTIRHFQIFKAVCEHKGVTAAAERLNITQPTVSIAIKELEVFYQTKLFDRINRTIYLTEAGERLLSYVDSILEQYDEAAAILRDGKTFSKCRLGVNISFAETHLSKLTSAIQSALPECTLQLTVQNNEQLENMLSDNKIDFAIYDGVNERSSKHIEILFSEKMVLLVSPSLYQNNSITLTALSTQPLLMRERGSGVRGCVDKIFISRNLPQNIVMESVSTMSLLALATQAMGFVFVPLSLAVQCSKTMQLQIVTIKEAEISRSYYLAHNKRKHLTTTMAALKNIIASNLIQ